METGITQSIPAKAKKEIDAFIYLQSLTTAFRIDDLEETFRKNVNTRLEVRKYRMYNSEAIGED